MTDDDADMLARHVAMLKKHQAQGDELADALHARAVAEPDAAEQRKLSSAWHRIVRSVRQAMALEARLKRDARAEAREAEARKALKIAMATGKVRPHHHVAGRLIWHEADRDENRHAILDYFAEDDAMERLPRDLDARIRVLERYEQRAAEALLEARQELAEAERCDTS